MATGRETIDSIIAAEARLMKLPVSMAYALTKCRRNDLGDLSGRILEDGIEVLEREGFHGIKVQINRARNGTLQFE